MGDLDVGTRVIGGDGLPCNVTAITPVMYGNVCYRVTFSDGASVVCDAGHLWQVDDYEKVRFSGTRVINTQEIFETYKNGNRNRYAIPVAKPLELNRLSLDIDPYVLGVWLGDGHSYSATITMHENDLQVAREIELCGYKTEIISRTESGVLEVRFFLDLPDNYCLRGHDKNVLGLTKKGHCAECARQGSQKHQRNHALDPIAPELQTVPSMLMRMGLLKGSNTTNAGNEKHIPQHYMRASFEQRLALLQGLMDTDGTIGKNGRPAFSGSSLRLVRDMRELLSTFGIKARYSKVAVKCNGKIFDSYQISFMVYDDLPIFRMDRKRNKLASRDGRRASEVERRRIVSVEPVESVPVRCITVDSKDSLYLCGRDFLVTHNTELLLNTIGFHVDQDPAPIIVMQPSLELAEAFSKDRIAPMVRDTPALRGKIADAKSRDSGNTILHKQFPGGHLTMIGANAPGQLAMRPVRVVLCDEVDKYPASAGNEGDPIKLLSERAATFWNYKMIFTCSPTVEGKSRIAKEYATGDQRVFEVDCPHCGHRHEMKWVSVKWPKGNPRAAMYHCPECGAGWTEPERQKAIRLASERPPEVDSKNRRSGWGWRAQQPFEGHASFTVSKLASPWEPIWKLAVKFEQSKDSQEMLKTFINTQLAETWKERGEAPEWQRLYELREDYALNVVPMRAGVLTAWVDVQKDRLEVEVVAWAPRRESWSIDYRVFMGDTSSPDASCWSDLDAMLMEEWQHECGIKMTLDRLGVDSGYNTQVVYNWVRKHKDHGARVMATKGQDTGAVLIGIPQAKEARTDGKRARRGVKVWTIGTNLAKSELYGFLRLQKPTEAEAEMPTGWCHFPQYDEEFFKMLTAEQVQAKVVRGYTRYEWTKTRERNEALDCRVGNRAIASAFGIDRWGEAQWADRFKSLGIEHARKPEKEQKEEEKAPIKPKVEIIRTKSKFLR